MLILELLLLTFPLTFAKPSIPQDAAPNALVPRAVPIGDVGAVGESAAGDAAAGESAAGSSSGTSSTGSYNSGTSGEPIGEDTGTSGKPIDDLPNPGPDKPSNNPGSSRPPAIGADADNTNSHGADWEEVIEQAVDAVKDLVENLASTDSQSTLATALPTNSAAVSSMIAASSTATLAYPGVFVPAGQVSWLSSEYAREVATARAAASAATSTSVVASTTSNYVPPATGAAVRWEGGGLIGVGMGVALAMGL